MARLEELSISSDPVRPRHAEMGEMLESADTNDRLIRNWRVMVDPVLDTYVVAIVRPARHIPGLCLAEGQADHVGNIVMLHQSPQQPTPSTADVEDGGHAGSPGFPGEIVELTFLCGLQCVIVAFPQSTGIRKRRV